MPLASQKRFDVQSYSTELLKGLRDYLPADDNVLRFSDLRIWTRDNPPQFTPFRLNDVQEQLLRTLCEQQCVPYEEPWKLRGIRASCLKARQQGMSTFWLALWYLQFYNLQYTQAIVLSHRMESTSRLWQTVEGWEQDCRTRLKWMNQDRPLRYSNRRELVRADTGSSILVATAGQSDVATSGLITTVHRSETGLWEPGAEKQIVGILGALPDWGNLVEESTARGFNEHKNRWDAQVDQPSAFFFPFTDSPEYNAAVPVDFEKTREESQFRAVRILGGRRDTFPVSDAALQWRRLKYLEYLKEGKPEATSQEFPLTPEEAFMASAEAAYYPTAYILALMDEMKDVKPVEIIRPGERGFAGLVEIFEEPQEGVEYTIGGDEAEGFVEDNKHDDSAGDGFRNDTREQVLVYHGRPDGVQFAYDLDALSAYFNSAMLVVERPPLGGTTCNKLIDLGANLYRHEKGVEGAPERTKYGFPARAKDLRDGALKAHLVRAAAVWEQWKAEGVDAKPSLAAREVGCPIIKSLTTLKQLLHYTELKGKKRGGVGAHDDHNTSASVATWYMENFTRMGDGYPRPEDDPLWRPAYAAQWSR